MSISNLPGFRGYAHTFQNMNYNGMTPSDDPMPTPGDFAFDDILNNQNILFQLLVFNTANKLMKTKDGMKTLQVLGKAVIDGLFDALDSGMQASAANHITAFAQPVMISMVLERLALLPPNWNASFHKSLSLISGFDQAAGFIGAIFDKDKGFPSVLQFAKGAPLGKAAMATRALKV